MKSLDLVAFATHSRKIPSHFLLSAYESENFSIKKRLVAYGTDFWSSYIIASFISVMCLQSTQLFMKKSGISQNLIQNNTFDFTIRMFPIIIFCYFFFCYLMNNGQTYGMFLVKKRIKMEQLSFRNALQWACQSTILCFSFGLSTLFRKESWNEIKSHDYLYHELIAHKDFTQIDLLSRIKDQSFYNSKQFNYKKAA